MNRLFGLIPAAGEGSRFGGEVPKQYTLLGGRALIDYSIEMLLEDERIAQVLVVVAESDAKFRPSSARVGVAAVGGATRAATVSNGLSALRDKCGAVNDDWVLVHDAARPCLERNELRRLIDTLRDDAIGGLLATPLADTLKRADEQHRCAATVPREHLWRAATPQMFRLGLLAEALSSTAVRAAATDEATAIEALGRRPRLVEGSTTNIKVTLRDDLPLVEAILRMQGRLG